MSRYGTSYCDKNKVTLNFKCICNSQEKTDDFVMDTENGHAISIALCSHCGKEVIIDMCHNKVKETRL